MHTRVITVSREFGAGGRTIGKLVAERLGYVFYDRELIARIAESSGLSPSYILEHGEYATSTSRLLFNLELHGGLPGADLPIPDQLYVLQHNIITELAAKEACVIVGRCADYALRDRKDCLHIFFHADVAFRANRIVDAYSETGQDPVKRLHETDTKRKVYYEYYTNRIWGMARNYHLSLDSGVIGIEKCADIVTDLARSF